MTEVLDKSAVSNLQSFVDELVQQATEAGMIVNGRKTKEILMGSVLCRDPPLSVILSGAPVERVTTFKLLGVHVANNRLEVGAACQGHLVQSCIAPPFPQAAETLGRRPG